MPSDFRNPDCVHGWLHGVLLGVAIMTIAGIADVYFGNPPCPPAPAMEVSR